MTKKPKIQDYITHNPLTIKKDASIKDAISFMIKNSIRHLPVTDEMGQVAGLVTDRDIKLASSFEGAEQMKVEGIMVLRPYSVESVVSLSDVALTMSEYKYGCALVLQDGKLIGIFTASDGLRVLGEMLEESQKRLAA
ncbi:MAG: CBS domain-containing protein [Bdellovibrionia bacterium]